METSDRRLSDGLLDRGVDVAPARLDRITPNEKGRTA